jgi:hypothetical protein
MTRTTTETTPPDGPPRDPVDPRTRDPNPLPDPKPIDEPRPAPPTDPMHAACAPPRTLGSQRSRLELG